MDPILIVLLGAALVAFLMAIIWSATKPKNKGPTIEPVENKPLPPIDEQIFDDVIDSSPVIIEEHPYEEEIIEDQPIIDEPEIEEESPPVLEEPVEELPEMELPEPAEVDENTNFDFEEEKKKSPPPPLPPEPEPVPEPESDNSYESSDSGGWDSGGDDD